MIRQLFSALVPRDHKLLAAAEPFNELRVAGERINRGLLQERTAGQTDEQRLLARVTHLQEILRWVDALPPPQDAASNGRWQQLLQQREVAHRILADREHPQAGDRTVSAVDPDARCGKHGDWYDGYLVDVLVDPDSEIITQVQVLPANGDEAADAAQLVRQEEIHHGNRIEQLSIDGIGYNGRVLRELSLAQCLKDPPKKSGRSVRKNDYEAEYQRAVGHDLVPTFAGSIPSVLTLTELDLTTRSSDPELDVPPSIERAKERLRLFHGEPPNC